MMLELRRIFRYIMSLCLLHASVLKKHTHKIILNEEPL